MHRLVPVWYRITRLSPCCRSATWRHLWLGQNVLWHQSIIVAPILNLCWCWNADETSAGGRSWLWSLPMGCRRALLSTKCPLGLCTTCYPSLFCYLIAASAVMASDSKRLRQSFSYIDTTPSFNHSVRRYVHPLVVDNDCTLRHNSTTVHYISIL